VSAVADPALAVRRWLPFPPLGDGLRLYCLPHAGGSASVYRSWAGLLDGVAVCPVQPPGRETRRTEPPLTRMAEVATAAADAILADAAGSPYAVFGHSLGALAGFEVIREIRRRGGPAPVHLIVSACGEPRQAAGDDAPAGEDGMTDTQILALVRALGGTPDDYLSDPRVLGFIMPVLRADLKVKVSYRYRPEQPLDVPITAIAATQDTRASSESMLGWRDQTVRRFQRATPLAGGHFALLEQPEAALRRIRRALQPDIARHLAEGGAVQDPGLAVPDGQLSAGRPGDGRVEHQVFVAGRVQVDVPAAPAAVAAGQPGNQ
jgi:surfactin synthase thioesterase subunit